jgi:hypothetical protein
MQKAFLVLAAMPGRPGTKKLSNLLVTKRSNRRMKKQLIFLAIAASLVLFACDPEDDTEVTISNQSSVTVYNVRWNGCGFGSISPGSTSTGGRKGYSLSSGSGYVFFTLFAASDNIQYHSLKKLTVSPGEVIIFYITNDTIEAKQQ